MARTNREVIYVEVVPDVKKRLKQAATVLTDAKSTPVDMSDIVREAVSEKLDRLARKYPTLQPAEAAA